MLVEVFVGAIQHRGSIPLISTRRFSPYQQAFSKTKQEESVLDFSLIKNSVANQFGRRENSEKKQRILGLIAEKQEEVLKGKSLDELKATVAELA